MTNDELELALQEVTERLAQFGPEEKLSNKYWRQYQQVKREKDLLASIKKARSNGSSRNETRNMMEYQLLKDGKKMNFFIRYLMQLKLRSQTWM
jgi:hypothetical protein